jgi:hypothetical protein
VNITFGSISLRTGNNFLNRCGLITLGIAMCKKTTLKKILKINAKNC